MKRLLLIFAILFSASCGEHENPIPTMTVYLNLDLTFEDKELKAFPSFKEYTTKNINAALGERIGFGGVLVVHTILDEYVAFDRACPYESNSTVTVEVDENVLNAVCPRCGTVYDLSMVPGAPNGKSKYYLKKYTVIQNGNKLIVKN
ncbi:MAG: (2Fe-2S)-binding protein [Tannerella sp.]|jgi:nitrite reductase/ring-hydroxylating ferredoxin subunit|nr:(2Fe-2S)-binding protein [Tannerella sp.]